MAKRIKVFDTTLRDGEQSPGCSMNLNEKLEVARQLENLGVDVIEAGYAFSSPEDFESVTAIAKLVKNAGVASLSRALEKDIDAAYDAVRHSTAPRVHVFLATSPIHMQHKLKMTEDDVVARAAAAVAHAKKYCSDIEFSAEDASRSDKAFLARVFSAVIAAGATVLNVPDTVGYSTPDEMAALVTYLLEHVQGMDKAEISVHCHNDLGLAVANTLACVQAGAAQMECTINGIGERAGNASLEELVMNLHTRADFYGGAQTGVNTKQIYISSKLIQQITGVRVAPSKAIVGDNAFAHESGIHQHGVLAHRETYEIMTPQDVGIPQNKMVLGKHSGRHGFKDRLAELGYHLNPQEIDEAFTRFKALADKKKVITDGDLKALVAMKLDESATEHVKLHDFIIASAKDRATATIYLTLGDSDEPREVTDSGSGPVDAAYSAINRILDEPVELTKYDISAASGDADALAQAVVKLRRGDKTATGRAKSTDTIEASILAYLNGINKLW
ncbi:MAG: 2-isopropylmalate synthase [Oscillospiraceae bacterium]|nr:2-isopropylmalate synthase [Oscillospiraceae bacterium]